MKRRSWTNFLALADDAAQLDTALMQEAGYKDLSLRQRMADWRREQETIADVLRTALCWEDIANASTILPDYEAAAHMLIAKRLGYLPHEAARLRHEPFLRGLLVPYLADQMDYDTFSPQADATIKLIRNADMAVHYCVSYKNAFHRKYKTYLTAYKEAAQERLSRFLGYVPQQQHALLAELWVRQLLAQDAGHLHQEETELDRRAMTIIKFREVLTERGRAAAESSPLWYSWQFAQTEDVLPHH